MILHKVELIGGPFCGQFVTLESHTTIATIEHPDDEHMPDNLRPKYVYQEVKKRSFFSHKVFQFIEQQ